MPYIPITNPVDLNVTTTGSWVDADVSTHPLYVASVVIGVELIFDNTGTNNVNFGCRKNGSTDARNDLLLGFTNGTMTGARIGVDGSGLFEAYISEVAVDVYLAGFYTADTASFFTNAVDKSQDTLSTWTDTDISSDTGSDVALAAFLERSAATASIYAVRMNGSTDDRRGQSPGRHNFLIAPCDGSELFEQWVSATDADLFLNGYLRATYRAAATFNTNAIDRSTATAGSYQTVTALTAGAIAGVYDSYNVQTTPSRLALRRIGSTVDIYRGPYLRAHLVVACDTSQQVEQKISSTDSDLWELGYFSAPKTWLS